MSVGSKIFTQGFAWGLIGAWYTAGAVSSYINHERHHKDDLSPTQENYFYNSLKRKTFIAVGGFVQMALYDKFSPTKGPTPLLVRRSRMILGATMLGVSLWEMYASYQDYQETKGATMSTKTQAEQDHEE
uniref:HIG1 domain-containing protein n=1 Tax=Vannella robusta TaxID=1487602 RepID=A0A7S4ILI5_9EUKA|mmetsp:Transcript_453/g.605  ORF Transcript_453/g.605 Transcript_453/m.605 type:complete len:130 (+) Transcript_453:2-391(+)